MHYFDVGEGETLVLIHGLGSTKESWNYQLELAKHYRLIVPDLRGHGSSTVFEDISISTFAKDVITLLDELEIQQAHFCGLSMGGLVVQEIYKQHPTRVTSMILSNTFSYVPFSLGLLSLNKGIEEIQNTTEEERARLAAKRCLFQKTPSLIEEVEGTFLIRPDVYQSSSLSAIQMNFLPLLPFVHVPVLVIGATNDPIIPVISIYQTAWLIPRANVHIFKNCGHMPNIEKKDAYNKLLCEFLQQNK